MNWLEFLGVIFIISTIAEAYVIYKYRFLIRQLFSIVLEESTNPYLTQQSSSESEPYRDAQGRFAKRPA